MHARPQGSPGLGLDKFEAQALGLPKLWSRLLGLGLGLACQGLRARACTSLDGAEAPGRRPPGPQVVGFYSLGGGAGG